jgi:hypothetical protein
MIPILPKTMGKSFYIRVNTIHFRHLIFVFSQAKNEYELILF